MRRLWLVAFVAGCGRVGFDQPGPGSWTGVPSGTSQDLHAIWGADDNLFVAGNGGTILRTTDRGVTWTPVPCDTAQPLYAGTIAGNTVIVSGDLGTNVVISNNGGSSFAFLPSGSDTSVPMYGVVSTDDGYVVEVGGSSWIVASSDFGADWGPYGFAIFGGTFYSAWLGPDRALFAAGEGGLLVKQPTGVATPIVQPTLSATTFRGIWGRTALELFAVGTGGALFHTRDGGDTWLLVPSGSPADLFGVAGTEAELFVAGTGGTVIYSDDNGVELEPQATGTTSDLFGLWISSDALDVVAVGASGTIIRAPNRP